MSDQTVSAASRPAPSASAAAAEPKPAASAARRSASIFGGLQYSRGPVQGHVLPHGMVMREHHTPGTAGLGDNWHHQPSVATPGDDADLATKYLALFDRDA